MPKVIVTICAVCGKIRQEGQWVDFTPTEDTDLSHGFCPTCGKAYMDKEVLPFHVEGLVQLIEGCGFQINLGLDTPLVSRLTEPEDGFEFLFENGMILGLKESRGVMFYRFRVTGRNHRGMVQPLLQEQAKITVENITHLLLLF